MKFVTFGSAIAAAVVLTVSASTLDAQSLSGTVTPAQPEVNQTATGTNGKCTGTKAEIKACRKAKRSTRRGSYN